MSELTTKEMCSYITTLISKKRNYHDELVNLTNKYRNVVFYGTGRIYESVVDSWNKNIRVKINYCCDSDSSKWGKFICGVKCLSPNELKSIKDESVVFVTIGNFKDVFDFLKESDFPSVNLLYKYDYETAGFLNNYSDAEIIEKLCKTYELLGDNKSRKVFNAVVTRFFGDGSNVEIMHDVCEGDQYFPVDIMKLSDHERFVDIGAFDGDTILDFIGRVNGIFDHVFAFEVDEINFNKLKNCVQKMPLHDKIEIFNLGIWSEEAEISYTISKTSSTVGVGEGRGRVVPLDDVLRGEIITFIKMDIEGAELEALRGAKGLIQAGKPKLAICPYHDIRHLWEIPLYIKELVPEYKIYLRHHSPLEYETVCYAVI